MGFTVVNEIKDEVVDSVLIEAADLAGNDAGLGAGLWDSFCEPEVRSTSAFGSPSLLPVASEAMNGNYARKD